MIALVLALSCPAVKMQNVSGHPWNDHDKGVLSQCKIRCQKLYSDAPCVKLFRKFGQRDYTVICGGPTK